MVGGLMKCPVCGGVLEKHTDGHYSPFGKTKTFLEQRRAWVYQCSKCKAQMFVPVKKRY
jgi:C4-type Zn-finger protein